MAFPLPVLAAKALMTVRGDYYGGVTLEAIPGALFDPEQGTSSGFLSTAGTCECSVPRRPS